MQLAALSAMALYALPATMVIVLRDIVAISVGWNRSNTIMTQEAGVKTL
jgi:hypothetical protein